MSPPSRVTAIRPHRAIEGARIDILGSDFPIDQPQLPEVRMGDRRARVVYASPTCIAALVPPGIVGPGRVPVRVEGLSGETAFIEVATPLANGLHQVDNPVFDREGNLYVTYSGARGEQVPVSIFRVHRNGVRESFCSGIVNPTSMALHPDGRLYVSSRFEGAVYRLDSDGTPHTFATDLGVACGLAFAPDGTLYVGDRSGTIFKVDPLGRASSFASLPASVAAFHLALGPDQTLFVTGPTLAPRDSVYQISPDGVVSIRADGLGRPQGLAVDSSGNLFVVEALAGASGLYRLPAEGNPEMVLAGPGLVGAAFDPLAGLVVCSNDTAYRLSVWSA
jgi:sugar lactone lactonase YvrE